MGSLNSFSSGRRTLRSNTAYSYERFHSRRQFFRLLGKNLLRWFFTAALCAAIYAILYSYSDRAVMPQKTKKQFNTLIIALTIALGLNIAASLSANAGELRWWILSRRKYSAREADLIINSHQFSYMIRLGWTTRHLAIQIFVISFVILNIASQIALALLGVTYNVDPSDSLTITKPGLVSIPDFSNLQTGNVLSRGKRGTQSLNARRYTANTFGLIGQAAGEVSIGYMPNPGTILDPDGPLVFTNDQDTSYLYQFYESTATNNSSNYQYTVATNRTVSTRASCGSFPVTRGSNGASENITIRYAGGDRVIELPVANGDTQTTYMHDPVDSNATWALVQVFESSSADKAWWYECDVYVDPVVNAVIPEHKLGANLTQFVPPAIALQGYGSSVQGLSNATRLWQFQSYPQGSYFGHFADGNTGDMELQLSRFAINVVVAAAGANENLDRRGMVPRRGVVLKIKRWQYVHLILLLTMGVQLAANVAAVVIANRVQVRGHSALGVAALLRPMLGAVSDRAAMATGKQIAELVGRDVQVQYLPASGGGYDVHVFETRKPS